MESAEIDPEVVTVLDSIVDLADMLRPKFICKVRQHPGIGAASWLTDCS